jgi:Flp pilus assembly protein TadD
MSAPNDSDDVDFDTAGIEPAPALSAPASRPLPAAPKSRAGLLVGLLGLTALGGVGGYYYLTQMANDIVVPAMQAATPPPQITFTPPPAAIPVPATEALAEVPPMDAAAPVITAPAPQAADLPAPPEMAAATPPATAAPAPQDTAPAAPTVQTDLPPPPKAEETDAPEELAPAETQSLPPTAQADLPPPPEAALAAADTQPEKILVEPVVKTAPAEQPKADAAEQALVSHAAELEKAAPAMPAPAAAIPAADAIIRPLPDTYIVVRKTGASGSLGAQLESARAALAQGRYDGALELFDALEKSYPADTQVLMGRAIALQGLGQDAQALTAYEAVLNRQPRNIEALTNMLGLLKGQDPQVALSRLQELRNTYPGNADIAAQLGVAAGTAGDTATALRAFAAAEALAPGDASVLYNKAVVLDRAGRTQEAAALYRAVLARASAGTLTRALPLESIRARLAVLR